MAIKRFLIIIGVVLLTFIVDDYFWLAVGMAILLVVGFFAGVVSLRRDDS